jgi:5-hydroxyisourate hydrolase-like protein (transthyretin family)
MKHIPALTAIQLKRTVFIVRHTVAFMLTLVLLMALFCVLNPTQNSYAASATGVISGHLLDGSRKNAPLSNQVVTLQMAQGNNSKDVTTAKTDAKGAFSFKNLSTDKTITYAVYIRYQDAQYTSTTVTLDSKHTQQMQLVVYPATHSTKNIAVDQVTILVNPSPAVKGLLEISEAFSFTNLSNETYVGSLDASNGKPNALLFSLPAGAKNISLDKGFNGYNVIQVDHGFASDAALLPGSNDFAFSFEVPYQHPSYTFNYQAQYPTIGVSVLVPTKLHSSASGLTSQGVVNAGSDQATYHAFTTSALLSQQQFNLTIDGLPLPPPATATVSSLNPVVVWIIVTVILILIIGALSWYLAFSRRKQVRNASGPRKKSHAKRSNAPTKKQMEAPSTATERREQLLQEMLRLDREYEQGKLTKAVYEERRGKTKALLRTVMSERETIRP